MLIGWEFGWENVFRDCLEVRLKENYYVFVFVIYWIVIYFSKERNNIAVVEIDEKEMERRKCGFSFYEFDILVGFLYGGV